MLHNLGEQSLWLLQKVFANIANFHYPQHKKDTEARREILHSGNCTSWSVCKNKQLTHSGCRQYQSQQVEWWVCRIQCSCHTGMPGTLAQLCSGPCSLPLHQLPHQSEGKRMNSEDFIGSFITSNTILLTQELSSQENQKYSLYYCNHKHYMNKSYTQSDLRQLSKEAVTQQYQLLSWKYFFK